MKDEILVCGSAPGYLLAVCRPVPDVLLLLLHAVFDAGSARSGRHRAAGARPGPGAQPGAAVRHEVVRPHVGAPGVLRGVAAGAELLLGGGAVLRRQTPPSAAAGHCGDNRDQY